MVICHERRIMEFDANGFFIEFFEKQSIASMGQVFIRFAQNQYMMYELVHEKAGIRKLYEFCYRDNLHSIWASQELYRKGNSREEFYSILERNMHPIYDSARRQGYEVWML